MCFGSCQYKNSDRHLKVNISIGAYLFAIITFIQGNFC